MKRAIILFVCLAAAGIHSLPLEVLDGPSMSSGMVKVLLQRSEESLSVRSSAPGVLVRIDDFSPLPTSLVPQEEQGVYQYHLRAAEGRLFINDMDTGLEACLLRPGPLARLGAGANTYRGEMLLAARGTEVFIINRVDIDAYLQGVLPYEVIVSWPAEALKAQAIASRSYAYTRRRENVHPLYDFDATTASQVYRGVAGEHPATNQAVADTAGLVLGYNGNIIPEHQPCGIRRAGARV